MGVSPALTTRYIYDGWNIIAEYTGTTLSKSYTWGMDLSGSMQGAGGVGGLLAVNDGTATYYPTFDGNGNVSEYLDSTGVVQAHYEYDAFGNTLVSSGTKVNDFAHRFSTKPLDAETGLYYYGYRYYDPTTGRWPSRDPIEERGGYNSYAFVGNNGVSRIDLLGLFIKDGHWVKWKGKRGKYKGQVCAEKGDTDNDLLRLIMGPHAGAALNPGGAAQYKGGEIVDVSAILSQLESVMRAEVLKAVSQLDKLNLGFEANPVGVPGQGSESLDLIFGGKVQDACFECFGAAILSHARGLQKSLFGGEFDKLGGVSAIGTLDRGDIVFFGDYEEDQGVGPKKAMRGDWTAFRGWSDGGAFANENVINVGADSWWGHPLGKMSEAKWYELLKTKGGGAGAVWRGTNNQLLFIDTDKVASTVWPWRGGH